MDIPEGKPLEGDALDLRKTGEIKLHRRTVVWLVAARLLDPMTQVPGVPPWKIARELFQARDWRLADAPIEQWVAYFAEQSRGLDPAGLGLNLVVGKPPAEGRRVTLDLKATSLLAALELAAKAAGMRVEEQEGNTLLLTPGVAAP